MTNPEHKSSKDEAIIARYEKLFQQAQGGDDSGLHGEMYVLAEMLKTLPFRRFMSLFDDLAEFIRLKLETLDSPKQSLSQQLPWPATVSTFIDGVYSAFFAQYNLSKLYDDRIALLDQRHAVFFAHLSKIRLHLDLLGSDEAESTEYKSFMWLFRTVDLHLHPKAHSRQESQAAPEEKILDPTTGVEIPVDKFRKYFLEQLFSWALLRGDKKTRVALKEITSSIVDPSTLNSQKNLGPLLASLYLKTPLFQGIEADLMDFEAELKGVGISELTGELWSVFGKNLTSKLVNSLAEVYRFIIETIGDEKVHEFRLNWGLEDNSAGQIATLSHNNDEMEYLDDERFNPEQRLGTLLELLRGEISGYVEEVATVMAPVYTPAERSKQFAKIEHESEDYEDIFAYIHSLARKTGKRSEDILPTVEQIVLRVDAYLSEFSYYYSLFISQPDFNLDISEMPILSQQEQYLLEEIRRIAQESSDQKTRLWTICARKVLREFREENSDPHDRLAQSPSCTEQQLARFSKYLNGIEIR